MALIIATLMALGTVFLTWGFFRSLWETTRDRIVGLLLMTSSAASFGAGWLGVASLWR